jgi:hypothetical protein
MNIDHQRIFFAGLVVVGIMQQPLHGFAQRAGPMDQLSLGHRLLLKLRIQAGQLER